MSPTVRRLIKFNLIGRDCLERISMRVSFACPSCATRGSTDSVNVGTQIRCKRCGADFAIPRPGGEEPDVYALEQPAESGSRRVPQDANQRPVFVPSRSEERRGSDQTARRSRGPAIPGPPRRGPQTAWLRWAVLAGVGLAVTLGLIALVAPQGTWVAGCILLLMGSLMVLAGYAAGAYGAFQEDLLYGVLYLSIPLYTAYYMLTRWDDLWIWLTCSTIGVGLILLGTELVRWAGAPI